VLHFVFDLRIDFFLTAFEEYDGYVLVFKKVT